MKQCFYFDGITAKAHECNIHLADECLYIYIINSLDKPIIWNKSSIKDFDLNNNHLIIKYGNFPYQTIDLKGDEAIVIYEKLAHHSISKKSKRLWLKNKSIFAIILSTVFIGVCLIAYFVFLPWVAEKSVALIPNNTEIELGDGISESILQSYEKEDSATYYANQFLCKIKTNSSYPIELTIIKSDEINAFALPGGKIFVYSAILKNINTYQEFTALIGHEISHVTYQHSLKSICRTTASSIFISFLFGDITGISSGILQQANEFKQLNYSRELEMQADDKGYTLMLTNQISPKGMIDLLTLLQKESINTPSFMKYFSTHPETAERLKNIQTKSQSSIFFKENGELKRIFNHLKSSLN